MENNNSVTVIVPVYNMELYLERCLESIINQTYSNIEILVINDGSNDKSQQIINRYAIKDKRIKSIIKENGGYGSVLTKALKTIKTNYFLICDADDYLEPKAIEVLITLSQNSDIVYGKYYNIYNSQKNRMVYNSFFNLIDNYKYKENLDRFVFLPVSPHAKLYKRNLFNNINIPEKIHYTDVLLYYYALNKAQTLTYVDKYLTNYDYNREGNTQTDSRPIIFDYHNEIVKQIILQCEVDNNKYFALGLLFYNLYTLIKLSQYDKHIITDKKNLIYNMFQELIPYSFLIDRIPESKESLIELKNKLLDKDNYKDTIDYLLKNEKTAQKIFTKELKKLSKT